MALKHPVAQRRTEFQKVFMLLRDDLGVRVEAQYVSIGRIARRAILMQLAEDRPLPADEKRVMMPKADLAAASLLWKCLSRLMFGESQKPIQRTRLLGLKVWQSSRMGEEQGGLVSLGERQCMSSVLSTEKCTLRGVARAVIFRWCSSRVVMFWE